MYCIQQVASLLSCTHVCLRSKDGLHSCGRGATRHALYGGGLPCSRAVGSAICARSCMGAAARPRVLSFLTPEKVPSMLTWVRPLFSLWHVHSRGYLLSPRRIFPRNVQSKNKSVDLYSKWMGRALVLYFVKKWGTVPYAGVGYPGAQRGNCGSIATTAIGILVLLPQGLYLRRYAVGVHATWCARLRRHTPVPLGLVVAFPLSTRAVPRAGIKRPELG
ncbi:hypothetical protein V8E53_012789 [Lactarius tabidus]